MKFLTVLAALMIQCAATKSWNSDSYSEDTFFVFSWFSYLKRFSIIALMLSGVILYYVPESRPHARRICYTLIDVTANGLKSALSTRESEFLYEKIKSKYQRARYEQALAIQKHVLHEVPTDDENVGIVQKNSIKKSKIFVSGDDALGSKEKKKSNKALKEHRQSRHRFRNNGIKDVQVEPCMEISKPVYLYTNKSDEYPKYMKKNSHKHVVSTKGSSGSAVENYALLISGSPQQLAMIDQKYDKEDVVIVQDPYLKIEYKECGTTTDKVSSKASSSEQEGPTRDHDYNMTDSAMETYLKEIELNSTDIAKYSVANSLNEGSQYCGGVCCGTNGCFVQGVSNKDLNNKTHVTMAPLDVKNVLKSSRSMVNPKTYKKMEETNENVYMVDYNHYNPEGDRVKKPINVSNSRKVEFQKDVNDRDKIRMQKHEESVKSRNKKFQNNDMAANFCCTNYHNDRGGEADDENSQFGKLNLGAKPQKENLLLQRSSDDSIFDYDFYNEPILKSTSSPVI
ncbi:uncharacterized protein LOC108629538 [Ceratina calcarata]|uniref:Uncharacterized protein LOC108629538 n=1 Tax=Ceratina calcarata TaxID=156304 RepID=A0AAJ7JA40_9HYME|nr:uncharacterized protein LOC108629538 [Ceratina calcarata]